MSKPHSMIDRRQFLGAAALAGAAAGLSSFPLIGQARAADMPTSGGHLRLGMGGGSTTDSLDPTTYLQWVPVNIGYQIMNGLIEIDEHNKATPELLMNWESKTGAADWVFDVRKDITFSNGKVLDADDIIYSINLHRGKSASPAKPFLAAITDIKKLSANQIGITMSQGNADLPFLLSDYHILVVPNGFTDWKNPIGTAGYVLEHYEAGVRCITKKTRPYWKTGCGNVDSIETLIINDVSARTAALLSGQVDAINRLDARTVDLLKKRPKVHVIQSAAGQHGVFVMNCTDAPFKDNNVRMALKYAINRQQIVDTVLRGYGHVGNDQPIPITNEFYDASIPQHTYDPDKAKFYLKQAGESTLAVDLNVSDVAFTGATDAAELFQQSAQAAGITVNLKQQPADGYWDNIWMKAPFCASYWGGRPTADQMLTLAYKSDAPWNDTFWKNADFDKLLLEARVELDQSKRKAMYGQMQGMISSTGGALIPIFIDYLEAGSNKVHGMKPNPMFDFMGQRIGEKVWMS
ncbi:ABC transporter substrate-binding protein [Acidisoma cellulosilytica]|uniref:ABC transporter substrate-binding protein n=1 Tax=Acidisoma cellulosilyticum TaxID=2802395 RepID=A0A963Z471_9PROT|nr:ABC transporter substrate-binding protein [Acidisoma cellulosilyticum]MCB8881607.1 ABC transporter substrate-binding protein [Acidisoma cellulosilyticum]